MHKPKDPISKTARINEQNIAALKFKKLRRGTYQCLITNVKDRAGTTLCDEETGKRKVSVKSEEGCQLSARRS